MTRRERIVELQRILNQKPVEPKDEEKTMAKRELLDRAHRILNRAEAMVENDRQFESKHPRDKGKFARKGTGTTSSGRRTPVEKDGPELQAQHDKDEAGLRGNPAGKGGFDKKIDAAFGDADRGARQARMEKAKELTKDKRQASDRSEAGTGKTETEKRLGAMTQKEFRAKQPGAGDVKMPDEPGGKGFFEKTPEERREKRDYSKLSMTELEKLTPEEQAEASAQAKKKVDSDMAARKAHREKGTPLPAGVRTSGRVIPGEKPNIRSEQMRAASQIRPEYKALAERAKAGNVKNKK